MKTNYIGIESISIIRENFEATIACNIMLEDNLYSEPIYTNIFCPLVHLRFFLKLDDSDLAKKILSDLERQINNTADEIIQIDLPSYINNQTEWNFPKMVNLEIAPNEDIPFQCYYLDIELLKQALE